MSSVTKLVNEYCIIKTYIKNPIDIFRNITRYVAVTVALMWGVGVAQGRTMWERFVEPEDSTRTKVWWFHGETETTREGIDADLAAFKDKGVGGVVFYDQVHGKCEGAFDSMSPEWWDMLRHAAVRARDLGLSFEVAASNGYVAGGPWITKEMGMKKTAYVDTIADVGADGVLRVDLSGVPEGFCDVATVMWRDDDASAPLTVLSGTVNVDRDRNDTISFEFPEGFVARGMTYFTGPRGKGSTSSMNIPGRPRERYFAALYQEYPPIGRLEVSDDGINWTQATVMPPIESVIGHKSRTRTVSFPAVSGRYGRVVLADGSPGNAGQLRVGDIRLYPYDVIDNVEVMTGLRTEVTYPSVTGADHGAVRHEDVTDVSASLSPEGELSVSVMPGRWRVMRFGYVPTGARTKHGRKNALGYEADVMSAEAAKMQFDNYFKAIADSLSAIGAPPSGMCMDSHEAGVQNWTAGFEDVFRSRRGYGLTQWLPVFAGYIVDGRDMSMEVLADFRRTVAETIADNFYGMLTRLCHDYGVTFTSQAMLNIDNDNIRSRGQVDKPQGEFWAYQKDGNYDVLDAASSAHLYGHPIASGEAFTDTPYSATWEELLRIANLAYCRGINEMAVCASSYQPWADRKYDDAASAHPYVFHRFHPRWDSSRTFWDYQARCAGMMREGRPSVDLCVYLGDELPGKTMAYRLPDIPGDYTFDVATSDALINRFAPSSDGRIDVKGGMSYKALLVEDRAVVSREAEEALRRLEESGVPVIRCRLGDDTGAMLAERGVRPSLTGVAPVQYARRTLPEEGMDVYILYNHSDESVKVTPIAEYSVRSAELWHPVVLTRTPLSLPMSITLAPYEAQFLITHRDARQH